MVVAAFALAMAVVATPALAQAKADECQELVL